MTTKFIFHNFTDKPFTGYWNGKAYTFKPGVKKYYPKGIAEHFAKHLTNEILTADNKERYTSPKKPLEVPLFMDIFNKSCLLEEVPDEDNLDIDEISGAEEPSMNIKTEQKPAIDPYDSSQNNVVGPGAKAQIIGSTIEDDTSEALVAPAEPAGDESTFEGADKK